jgi:N6-adenosine-specific RNA methylase IME4
MTKYGCILADPPWKFGDKLPGKGRGASKHYPCMSVSEIQRFPLPPIADNCWLFLWRVASMQREALDVVNAWGFTVKSELCWVKTSEKTGRVVMGMGRSVRNAHEICLVCTKGKPIQVSKSVSSVIEAPRGYHSTKPEQIQDAIEALVGDVHKVELFARRHRAGWLCLGNQIDAAQAAE